jgi:predicted DNA-binding transcriptional regulator YafY
MRADRLLSILLLLQVHRRLTAGELATRLEVSQRTIHRDMDALSAAGVPVYAQRGASGGWALTEGYRTNATGLTEAEIRTVFLAKPPRLLADLGLDGASEAALIKLLAALPSAHRRGAEDVRQRIHIDVSGWHPAEADAVPALPILQDAIWRERKLLLTYRPQGGEPAERLVEPLGLVAKGSTWYLIAAVDGEPRTYRVSRIVAARSTEGPFLRPEGFDLAAYWEQSKSDFVAGLPRYHATVRVDPTILPRLRFAARYARVDPEPTPDPDGWIRVAIRFQFAADAREFVLGFGPTIEVLDPPELRDDVIALARAVVARYADPALDVENPPRVHVG